MTQPRLPEYAFPAGFVLRWLLSWAFRRPRDVGRDGGRLIARRAPSPHTIGEQRIPATGSFIAIMNHYEPAGLRVWWPALLVSSRIAARRQQTPPLRWLIADRFFRTRWHRVPIPDGVIAWAFRQLARTYALIIVARGEPHARAIALRRSRRALREPGAARPLGVTPEGALASGGVLARPVPNSALALAWLSRSEIPLLPVAVYNDGSGRLTLHIGEPFTLPWPGLREARRDRDALTQRVMSALAVLMPAELRGPFAVTPAEPSDQAHEGLADGAEGGPSGGVEHAHPGGSA